jgi:hypothetical protein
MVGSLFLFLVDSSGDFDAGIKLKGINLGKGCKSDGSLLHRCHDSILLYRYVCQYFPDVHSFP